jgi:UDP-N-acetylglucosamine:LPS N-acetylglucosamine transferase
MNSPRGQRGSVLIAYSRVGGGHHSAAQALATALERASAGRLGARMVDAYVERGRFPLTRFPAMYARMARSHPRLWATVFYVTNWKRLNLEPTVALRPFLLGSLRRLLSSNPPELVVSVLPAINGLLARAIKKEAPRVPFEVVLTDWAGIHRSWVASGVDQYSVPTEVARADCLRYGVDSTRVAVHGLPIRDDFARPLPTAAERAALRTQLGLDPGVFTILAMVGAEGSPRALGGLAALARQPLDAQLVVVCGRNVELRAAVERLARVQPVRVLGFVENVAELMTASDLLVTKAGGVTLAEAFARGVPVVVNDVLPGQEAGNAAYAEARGAIACARQPAQLAELVAELRASPARRAELVERAAALARPYAADEIATAMVERLERS